MTTVTRARRGLTRAIDKLVKTNRLVCSFIDLVTWPLERIALNALRERFAKTGGTRIVGQQHNVTRPRQHVVVPTESPVVTPHVGRTAMHHYEKRILLGLIEVWRQRDHIVNALARFAREPEMEQRLPVNL